MARINFTDEMNKAIDNTVEQMESNGLNNISKQYISSDVKFYNISDLVELMGWGETTVQRLFNDPSFPAANFGRQKIVEAHALIDFFSKRHVRKQEAYWR